MDRGSSSSWPLLIHISGFPASMDVFLLETVFDVEGFHVECLALCINIEGRIGYRLERDGVADGRCFVTSSMALGIAPRAKA